MGTPNTIDLGGLDLQVRSIKVGNTAPNQGTATNSQSVNIRHAIGAITEAGPTIAELTAIFGTPASVGDGFIAVVDDSNSTDSVLAYVSNGAWHYALGAPSA